MAAPVTDRKWLDFVERFVAAHEFGRSLGEASPTENIGKPARGQVRLPVAGAHRPPTLLLCSPHPDDEILTGALPLRLARENNARVVNLAVTFGSNEARQEARFQELAAACGVAGFEMLPVEKPYGFCGLNPGVARSNPQLWERWVEQVAAHLETIAPDMVFLPHDRDAHPTHLACRALCLDALVLYTARHNRQPAVIETEFWGQIDTPNLLVGVGSDDLALLIEALVCHQGEIARNPYHLFLPPMLMDAVRRGSELVHENRGGLPFLFGGLYRLNRMREGRLLPAAGKICVAPDCAIIL